MGALSTTVGGTSGVLVGGAAGTLGRIALPRPALRMAATTALGAAALFVLGDGSFRSGLIGALGASLVIDILHASNYRGQGDPLSFAGTQPERVPSTA